MVRRIFCRRDAFVTKQAFLLAAGKGERMRPHTLLTPKPLLIYRGKPILEHWFDRLEAMQMKRVVVNAHYLAEQIVSFCKQMQPKYSFEICLSVERELLGTGGGLKQAFRWLDDAAFWMMNADTVVDGFEWARAMMKVSGQSVDAVWCLDRAQSDQTKVGVANGRVVSIGDFVRTAEPTSEHCFTGIQWVQKVKVDDLPDQGCIIRDYFKARLEGGATIMASEGVQNWHDLGTPERFRQADADFDRIYRA